MAKKLTKSSSKYISEPGEHVEYQSRLHHAPGFKQSQLRVFPPVSGDLSTLRDILATGGYKGNDWEFRPDLTPTICAVTTLDKIYSAPWSEAYKEIFREAMLRGVAADGQRYRWVAHSTVGADKAVADKVFGITTNLDDWDDSMISHYLANQHLVKAPDKDESDDIGSLGFMDLWSTASLVTDLWRWKGHRGDVCAGPDPTTPGYSVLSPCPRCLRGESLVTLADGSTMRINKMVKDQHPGPVLSVEDGKLVSRPVTNWYHNPRNGRPFVRVSFLDSPHRSKSKGQGVVVTDDHEFLTRRGWIPARSLRDTDEVCTGLPDYSENCHKFLPGILLGDSHLTANGKLTISHGAKQVEYLNLKLSLLGCDITRNRSKNGRQSSGTAINRGAANTFLVRKYKKNWEQYLREALTLESLVVWFLDDGSYHKYQITISVKSYTNSEREFLAEQFSRVAGVEVVANHNAGVLVLRTEAAQEFIRKIAKYVPPCLRYKLAHPGISLLDEFDVTLWSPSGDKILYSPVRVSPSSGRINWNNGNECDSNVYCLEVEGTNNFITTGGVVHNCSPMSYCGVDAWVSPVAHLANMETLKAYGVPESFYRDMMELSEICHIMQQRGVKVDRPYVAKMSLVAEEKKAALFPVIAEGRHKTYAPFNPRSNPQVIAWFKERKVALKKIDKAAISEALDKLAKAEGFPMGLESINDDDDPQMSEALTALYNLNTFKIEGKGLDPWFHDKYLDEEGFAHPRFILTGTSTGRLSSSGPNFQNVPRRGIFGELVRGAIIPRDSSLKLLKSDFSQLEFRVCLYLGGEPYSGSDVFNWMVDQTGDSLYKVAKDFDPIKYEKDPQKAARDITKGVAHGCLTGDHEVLTPEGWVRIDQWNGQEIAEWSKEGTSVEFKRPLKYHSYETTPIYSITGPAFSQVATGNHRFPVATTGNSEGKKYICWQDMTPETWEGRNSGKLPVAGLHDYADPEFSDLDLQRAIAIQADGSTRGNGRWGFHVKKLRKVERLRQLFGDSPKLDADGTYRLTVNYDKPDLLTSDKKLSWGFLKTSLRQKKLCLREATLWDGSILKTSAVYNNSCLQSVSIMQTLSHLAGGQSKVNSAGIGGFEGSSKEVFRVSFNRRAMAAKDRLEVTPAGEAPVYCFTTHSGYFLVRHNGHVSVTGNSNYGEGMVLLDPKQLNDQHILKLVAAGALSIYTRKYKPWLKRDWTFHGKVVAFTGANLAERLFGSRSVENRAKALAIQEDIYFARFRAIREWQIRVLDKVQETGYVQSPTGRFLRLFGTPEEIAKVAIAFLGQGVGADHVQGIMLRFRREQNRIPILQVHDELVFEQDLSLTKAQSVEYIKLMEGETNRLPGFTCPVEAKWGPNWKDMETVYKNGEMVQ